MFCFSFFCFCFSSSATIHFLRFFVYVSFLLLRCLRTVFLSSYFTSLLCVVFCVCPIPVSCFLLLPPLHVVVSLFFFLYAWGKSLCAMVLSAPVMCVRVWVFLFVGINSICWCMILIECIACFAAAIAVPYGHRTIIEPSALLFLLPSGFPFDGCVSLLRAL